MDKNRICAEKIHILWELEKEIVSMCAIRKENILLVWLINRNVLKIRVISGQAIDFSRTLQKDVDAKLKHLLY